MRYALLVANAEAAAISEEERSRRDAAFTVFQDEMRARGVLVGSQRLHPPQTATTVRCWDGGDVEVAAGPFATTTEQIACLVIVECKDLDEATEVATKIPAAWYGAVEIRPVWET
jgi:hypothetical protein